MVENNSENKIVMKKKRTDCQHNQGCLHMFHVCPHYHLKCFLYYLARTAKFAIAWTVYETIDFTQQINSRSWWFEWVGTFWLCIYHAQKGCTKEEMMHTACRINWKLALCASLSFLFLGAVYTEFTSFLTFCRIVLVLLGRRAASH